MKPEAMSSPVQRIPGRSLVHDLWTSLRQPEFWAFSSWLDIVVRSRQSRLGLFWLVSPVIVYIWGVGFFFANMMGVSLAQHAAYVALGYVVFRCVSAIVTDATSAFAVSGAFILDGHVRLTDFVLRVVATAVFHVLLAAPVVLVALALSPMTHWTGLWSAALAFPLVIFNGVWIAVLLALLGARFLDLRHLVANIFMFTFLLTPIVWHAEMMPPGSLRGAIMRFNPFYHFIEVVRAPLLGTSTDPTTLPYLAVMTVVGWCLAMLSYRRYARYVPLWV